MLSMMFDQMDRQDRPPIGECARCGAEIYSGDSELCTECDAEINSNDIVVKYAEAWPRRLLAFLWDQKDENYMKEFFTALREYCEGAELSCPDFEEWAKS